MKEIIQALREVKDPEIGVNIYDLGLIYDIKVEGKKVKIIYTLTTPLCPLSSYFADIIEKKVKEALKDYEVELELTFDPPWTPKMIKEEGLKELKKRFGEDVVEEWLKNF